MLLFPFMQKIEGKRFLVVGAGAIARRKVRLLLQFTDKITVITHAQAQKTGPKQSPEQLPGQYQSVYYESDHIFRNQYLAEPTNQAYLADQAEPANPVNKTEPANPVNKTEPANPADKTEPASPTDKTEPANPVDKTDPASPADKTEPASPADLADLADLAESRIYSTEELAELSEFREKGVEILDRSFAAEDLQKADYCIASADSSEENKRIAVLCRWAGIPVNVPDNADISDFFMPSVVKKGDLVIAVSTSGGSPAMSAAVRRRIEDILPPDTEEILDRMEELRSWVPAVLTRSRDRAELYKDILSRLMDGSLEAAHHTVKTAAEEWIGQCKLPEKQP